LSTRKSNRPKRQNKVIWNNVGVARLLLGKAFVSNPSIRLASGKLKLIHKRRDMIMTRRRQTVAVIDFGSGEGCARLRFPDETDRPGKHRSNVGVPASTADAGRPAPDESCLSSRGAKRRGDLENCHREEQSDVAISRYFLPRTVQHILTT
jgi:hypothetical protein